MIALDAYPIPEKDVVGRVVNSETPGQTEAVLVLPSKGKVKVLNEVGSRIWSLSDGTRTISEIVATICDEYDVNIDEAQVDTIDFLTDLLERGVITLSDTAG